MSTRSQTPQSRILVNGPVVQDTTRIRETDPTCGRPFLIRPEDATLTTTHQSTSPLNTSGTFGVVVSWSPFTSLTRPYITVMSTTINNAELLISKEYKIFRTSTTRQSKSGHSLQPVRTPTRGDSPSTHRTDIPATSTGPLKRATSDPATRTTESHEQGEVEKPPGQ